MSDQTTDTPMERAARAYIAACYAAQHRRAREERDYRASRGWGNFLNAAEYRELNRYIDRVMLDSPEMKAVQATRLAFYAISAQEVRK